MSTAPDRPGLALLLSFTACCAFGISAAANVFFESFPLGPLVGFVTLAMISAILAVLFLRVVPGRILADAVEGPEKGAQPYKVARSIVGTAMFFAVFGALISARALMFNRVSAAIPLACLSVAFGVHVFIGIDRVEKRLHDAWRRARSEARRPDELQGRRVGRPQHLSRSQAELPRASEVLRERWSRSRTTEHLVFLWLLVGLPLSTMILGPFGVFAFPGVLLVLLAMLDIGERRGTRGLRAPSKVKDRERARRRIVESRQWWSASPPQVLKRMRLVFLIYVVASFVVCIALPYLRSDDPAQRYRWSVPFVVGFLLALIILTLAEREQVKRERRWLERRREQRGAH